MRTLYAVHIPLSDRDDLSVARHIVSEELAHVADRHEVVVATESLGDGKLISTHVTHPDGDVPGRSWHLQTWAGAEGDDHWVRVRLGVSEAADAPVVNDRVQVFRPRVVSSVIEQCRVRRDNLEVSIKPFVVGARDDAEALRDLITAPSRQLPLVGVSEDADRVLGMDAALLAEQLAAQAHVVCIGRDTTWDLTSLLGREFGVFGGATRLWWPTFTFNDSPFDHPLWTPQRTSPRSPWELARRIRDAMSARLGVPDLERRLRRHEREHELARLRKSAKSRGDLDKFFDQIASQNEKLEDRIAELQAENESLRSALTTAEENLRTAFRYNPEKVTASPTDELVETPPSTVREAVERARLHSDGALVIHDAALRSAEESEFSDPSEVDRLLTKAIAVASEWRRGDGRGDFRMRFEAHGVTEYKPGISDTAVNMYASDYELRLPDGLSVLMGPHLRKGVGSPTEILRIYWYVDEANRQFIVGHVGKKLRDDSNN